VSGSRLLRLCVLCGLFITAAGHANEMQVRLAVKQEVQQLYKAKRYEELLAKTSGYLNQQSRTPSGVWKHSLVYDALAGLVNERTTSEDYWQARLRQSAALAAQFPEQALYHLLHARMYYAQAMMLNNSKDRGVNKQAVPGFKEALQEARNYLRQYEAVVSKDPWYYDLMLNLAREQQWSFEEYSDLLHQATQRYPGYYELYFSAVRYLRTNELRPEQAVEELAMKAMSLTAATDGRALYARVHWLELQECHCSNSQRTELIYQQSNLQWDMMMSAIGDLLLAYPDQWNINNMAYFSCFSGHASDAKILLDQIKGPPNAAVWKNHGFFESCRKWADTSHAFHQR